MKTYKLNKKGFAHVELLLIVVVILAVVGAGYYVLKARTGGIFNSSAETSSGPNATRLAANSANTQTPVSEREYTFELQKDGRAVGNGETVRGSVVVGVNMNVDRNLSNVKFLVDGVEVGSKQGIGLTGFRDFYTWATRNTANGQHTITVKATGSSGKEFELYSSATNTKSLAITVDNGDLSRVPASGGSGTTGNTNGGGSTTNPSTPAGATLTPQLSVQPGPLSGVAGSQSGTVTGQDVSGGIVFEVKFKRPKTEAYDEKTMNVVLTRDGVPRITMSKDNNSLEVKEVGDFKVYTFKRYYATSNKPNGSSTWQAKFLAAAAATPTEEVSNSVVITVNNPNSLADKTCKEAKDKVNKIFGDVQGKLDKNQAEINEVGTKIDERYSKLGLAASNPIPDYDAKKAQLATLNAAADAKQTELEALEIKCADGPSPEDVGATVAAFQLKLEEAKGALSSLRAATINLLGELRSRLPQDDNDDDDVAIPAGFEKYSTPCYSFAVRRNHTTSRQASGLQGACNKVVTYSKSFSGSNFDFTISPAAWKLPQGSLDENVAAAKAADRAAGSSATEFVDEQRFQLDGRDAVRYTVVNPTPIRTLRVIVAYPYQVDGQAVGGFDISMLTGPNESTDNSTLTGFAKNSADKALATWRWKDAAGDGDNAGQVPDGFKKAGMFCYGTVIPNDSRIEKINDNFPNNACDSQAQFAGDFAVFVSGIDNVTGLDAIVREAKERRRALTAGVNFEDPQDITIGGQPGKKIPFTHSVGKGVMYVSLLPQDYSYSKDPRAANNFKTGSTITFSAVESGFNAERRAVMDAMISNWRWKNVPAPEEKFSKVDTACFSVELPKKSRQQIVTDPPTLETSCINAYIFRSQALTTFGKFYTAPGPDESSGATLESNFNKRMDQLSRQNATVSAAQSITLDGQPGLTYQVNYQATSGVPDIDQEYLVTTPKTYTFETEAGVNDSLKTLMFVVNTNNGAVPGGFTQAINTKLVETWEWK